LNKFEQRQRALSSQLASFGSVSKKKIVSPYVKKNLSISDRLAALGTPKVKVIEKKVYLGEPGAPGAKPTRSELLSLIQPLIPKVKDGETPKKGVHYFTVDEVESIKDEIMKQVQAGIVIPKAPEVPVIEFPKALEIDAEFVKKIIAIMHSLPEKDKLEVSQGIRNAQSFIYKGTKYGMAEMMHGGGSSSSSSSGYQVPTAGLVNGVNQVFTWATAPNVIVTDQGRAMQRVSSDGTVNWTGTTTTTLAVAPNNDIYATS